MFSDLGFISRSPSWEFLGATWLNRDSTVTVLETSSSMTEIWAMASRMLLGSQAAAGKIDLLVIYYINLKMIMIIMNLYEPLWENRLNRLNRFKNMNNMFKIWTYNSLLSKKKNVKCILQIITVESWIYRRLHEMTWDHKIMRKPKKNEQNITYKNTSKTTKKNISRHPLPLLQCFALAHGQSRHPVWRCRRVAISTARWTRSKCSSTCQYLPIESSKYFNHFRTFRNSYMN